MTSNQIAAQSNAIRREELEETKRHNLESENIDKDRNRIEEAYKTQMADIERQKTALTEELGKLNIEWQSANEARKREIEARKAEIDQELANLKQFEANVEAEYKTGLITVSQMNADETKRSNQAKEAISERANKIKEHEVDIQERHEAGATKLSRAQIISQAGGVKGPFGLGSLGAFYAGELAEEAYQKGASIITEQTHNSGVKKPADNGSSQAKKAGSSIKFNKDWAQTGSTWIPARDR